jgi:hypothetical protein
MDTIIARHALRTLLLSILAVLVSGAWPQALARPGAVQDPASSLERYDDDRSYEYADATIVVRWSQLAEANALALDPAFTDPFPSSRGWTMMYLAMHDALNAIVRKFQPYAFFGIDPAAHPIAATAQAAHDVMNHIYPTRQADNDAELAFWLGQVRDGRSKTRGITLGRRARRRSSMLAPTTTCSCSASTCCRTSSSLATIASSRRWSSSTDPRRQFNAIRD